MENTVNLTPIVEIVISLIGILLTTFLVPWLKNKLSAQKLEMTMVIVKSLVKAAEQLYGAGHGDEKLQYVVDAMKAQGYEINLEDITDKLRAMIEAEVLELDKK